MDEQLIRAHLNLGAILQNLETLPQVDAEIGRLCGEWKTAVQFSVRGGPHAYVEFDGGQYHYAQGMHPHPGVWMFFVSPGHVNSMFDGRSMPILLKGFSRLGFLKQEFMKLPERLTTYLKPEGEIPKTPEYLAARTTLLLYTAVYATQTLAALDPTSKQVAGQTPSGALQIEVLPEGPLAHVTFGKSGLEAGKGRIERPAAIMRFADMAAAHALFAGEVDSFRAIASGKMMLSGQIPLIDNLGLILDRIAHYMK